MILIDVLNRLPTLYLYFFASLCMLSYSEDAPNATDDSVIIEENSTFTNLSDTYNNSAKDISGSVTEPSAIESSFEDLNNDKFSPSDFTFVEVASQNSGLSNEFVDTGQAAVVTLSDAALTELQHRADIPSESSENTMPNVMSNSSTEQLFSTKNVESQNVSSEVETNRSEESVEERTEQVEPTVFTTEASQNITGSNEDIPSFSEWAQRQLEEAEKKKELVNSSVQSNGVNGKGTGNVKVRSKNYASLDCGAKIVAANPEAVSASAVLSSSRDEYKLNACQNRIWFIVELCEAIQAKKIDLANFELFSSSPKDFSVYVSDRYPSRDWMNVGHFKAKDERDIQSFDLNPQLFGKFVKVEMHSHHGSEHFCPISLFHVYGTSEFEVLEKENQAHVVLDEDEDDESLDSDDGQEPKNLFSSATDAVISIVKKAAEVLGNKQNSSNYTMEEQRTDPPKIVNSCTTPSHLIVCDNCSDILFGEVYELISCKANDLYNLMQHDLIRNTIYNTHTCIEYGLDFKSKRLNNSKIYNRFISSIFSKGYVAALCNTAAVLEKKVVLNISKQFPNVTKEVPKELEVQDKRSNNNLNKTENLQPTEQLSTEKIQLATSIPNDVDISHTSQIKPTKTLTPDNDNTHSTPGPKDEKTVQPTEQLQTNPDNKTINYDSHDKPDIDYNLTDIEVTTESSEDIDILNELNNLSSVTNNNNSRTPSSTTPQVKESVFLRLSNRIKALERNMSLSSQYLEELSRRYKKQVEEMQRLLDKTLASFGEESKKRDEHNKKLENQIGELSAMVQTLVEEKNSWIKITYWVTIFLVLLFAIFTFCRRAESKHPGNSPGVKVQRRQSIGVVNHSAPPKKVRRPSEEALKISGSYKDLMRNEDTKKKVKDRKRKKKKPMSRSTSFDILPEENTDTEFEGRSTNSESTIRPSGHIVWRRLDSAPAQIATVSPANRIRNDIEDVPFVLDECDNSPLEDLPSQPRVNSTPTFMRTASEMRMKRRFSTNGSLINGNRGMKTLDDTRQSSPSRSSEASSVINPSDEIKKGSSPKKDRKGAIKRILKKVF